MFLALLTSHAMPEGILEGGFNSIVTLIIRMWTWPYPVVQNLCLKYCGRKQLVKSKAPAYPVTHFAQIKSICISKMYPFYSKPAIEMEMVLGEQPVPSQWSWGMRQSLTLNPNLDLISLQETLHASLQRWVDVNATCLLSVTNSQGRGI